MLTGPNRKFCEGVASGLMATDAYLAAYPKGSRHSAGTNLWRLKRRKEVREEIARLRAEADATPGSAVMQLLEKRKFLARLVRARIALLPEDSDLFSSIRRSKEGVEFRLGDKLAAIKLDNDLTGEGSGAAVDDALTQLLHELRQ